MKKLIAPLLLLICGFLGNYAPTALNYLNSWYYGPPTNTSDLANSIIHKLNNNTWTLRCINGNTEYYDDAITCGNIKIDSLDHKYKNNIDQKYKNTDIFIGTTPISPCLTETELEYIHRKALTIYKKLLHDALIKKINN